eukprot:7378174-Prymnesium_polylepis.1
MAESRASCSQPKVTFDAHAVSSPKKKPCARKLCATSCSARCRPASPKLKPVKMNCGELSASEPLQPSASSEPG